MTTSEKYVEELHELQSFIKIMQQTIGKQESEINRLKEEIERLRMQLHK